MKTEDMDTLRWCIGADGTVWINVDLVREVPFTMDEVKAMQKAVEEWVARGEGDGVH